MNKLAIPAILAATVLVAGIFAFSPVEQASTVHLTISSDISGAPTTVTDTVTTLDLNADNAFHHFVLTSEVPFTIHDIEVEGTIVDAGDGCDEIRVLAEAYPAEYLLDGIQADDDGRTDRLFGDDTVVAFGDNFLTQTWSRTSEDGNDQASELRFTENTNVILQIQFTETNCGGIDTADYTADVTFYISGASEAQVELTLDDNIAPGDTL